jgi:hypothetical protein
MLICTYTITEVPFGVRAALGEDGNMRDPLSIGFFRRLIEWCATLIICQIGSERNRGADTNRDFGSCVPIPIGF